MGLWVGTLTSNVTYFVWRCVACTLAKECRQNALIESLPTAANQHMFSLHHTGFKSSKIKDFDAYDTQDTLLCSAHLQKGMPQHILGSHPFLGLVPKAPSQERQKLFRKLQLLGASRRHEDTHGLPSRKSRNRAKHLQTRIFRTALTEIAVVCCCFVACRIMENDTHPSVGCLLQYVCF